MDIQRSIIFAAIAVVSYLLILEWNEFRELRAPLQPPVATEDFIYEDPTTSSIPGNESIANKKGANSDIPELEVSGVEKPKELPVLPQAKMVRVKTDVLDFAIDTTGGDIISLSLPKHYAKLETPDVPYTLLTKTPFSTYIAQSGLIGKNGTDTSKGRPKFSSAQSLYQLDEGQEDLIVDLIFHQSPEITITKRFHLKRNDYLIEIEYLIDNRSSQDWNANFFAQIKRDNREPVSDGGDPMGMKPFLGAALRTKDKPYEKVEFEDLEEQSFKEKITGGYIAMVQHYFVSAWIPNQETENNFNLRKVKNKDLYIFGFTSSSETVSAGQTGSIKANYYAGPKDQYKLEKLSKGLDLTIDYGWLWFVAQPLFALLTFYASGVLHLPFDITLDFGRGLGNWGFTIIMLTLTVKAIFFPLSAASYRSMANMRRVQPKMLEIKDRYGDNRQKMSEETMKLYKEEKVNPLGGCLPILVQMPVFIALYWVLLESVELRHAPFVGYIKDLSVMDPYFIMPIIMGATMYIQQKLNPPPPDPMQAKVMQMMPIMFTFFFLWFPAGLVLYWVVNNTLSIIQQYIITKNVEAAALEK